MQSIPKLDLSHFTHGSDSQKHHFVNELGYAYEHIGFVAIRNHGIPNEVLTDLYREVKNFFDLSERVKMQYDDSMGGGQRGYTGFGKEHAKNRNAGDLKEFWHSHHRLPENPQLVKSATIPAIVIKKAGDYPAFWDKDTSFIEVMEEMYQRVRNKNAGML